MARVKTGREKRITIQWCQRELGTKLPTLEVDYAIWPSLVVNRRVDFFFFFHVQAIPMARQTARGSAGGNYKR